MMSLVSCEDFHIANLHDDMILFDVLQEEDCAVMRALILEHAASWLYKIKEKE